jgi:hypothetical protein
LNSPAIGGIQRGKRKRKDSPPACPPPAVYARDTEYTE